MNASGNVAEWLAIFEKDIVFVVHCEISWCRLVDLSGNQEGNTEERVDSEAHVYGVGGVIKG